MRTALPFLLAAALALGPPAGAAAGSRTGAFLTPSPLSTSLEPVRVKIGDWRMAIPEAYLDAPIEQDAAAETFLTEDGFHNTSGVLLVTELPDLTPRTAASMHEWLKHRGWGKWISVHLRRSKVGIAGPSDVIFRIYSGVNDRGAEVHPKGMAHGLEWLAIDRAGNDNFVKFENGERTVFITCKQKGSVPFPGCSQFIRIRPALTARVLYGRQYLPRWQEIEQKVRALIDGFIAAAAAPPATPTQE